MSTKVKKLMLVAAFALILAMALGINAFAARDQVGDLNRDGVKDENDAIYLLNHYIFGGDYEIDQPSDYNGDGKVDEDDAIYLLNNIIFGDYRDLFHICDYPEEWALVETVEPTCKEGGYTIVKCGCGKEATILPTEKTDAHSFDWEKADLTHQATCLENGYITATCTVCGETETQQQAATGNHNWKKGSCEVGDMCTECGTQLPASGHKYPETPTFTQPATCKGGYEEYKCQNEGCESSYRNDLKPTDHRFAENAWQIVGERATDIECKYVYVETAKCEDCGETFERTTQEVIKHTETTSVTLATCVKPGQKIRSCSVCKTVIETTEMPVNEWAHSFDEGTTVGSVTTFKCQNEGCKKEKTTVKATEDGKVDLKDAEEVELNNGAAIIPDENIKEELGGKDVSISIGEVKAEDLAGLKDEDKEKLKELGDAPVFDLNLTVGGEKVTNFGENNKMTVRLPYTLAEGDDPDCIIIWYIGDEGEIEYFEAKYVDGYAVFETNHFSYYTVTRMTPAQRCEYYKKHNYQTTEVPATCVTGGYTLEICTRCGHKNITNETEALGHKWETTERAPSCTEAGQKINKCKACDISYREVISAIGHSIKESTEEYVAPSCTAKGVKVYRCENKNCSFSYTEEVAQIDHEYETEEVEADCQNGGYKNHKCKHCNHEYKSDQKKAKGHKYGVHGKCEHCGTECVHEYKYGVCTSCQKQKEKPKPEDCNHNYNEESKVEATCTTAGKIVYKCKKCDNVNEKEIPALGHDHAEAETINATCTTAGKIVYKCNKCDDVNEKEIPALGHDHAEAETINSTCTTAGKIIYKCKNCDDTIEKVLSIIPHDYKCDVDNDTGDKIYTCVACGHSYKENGKKDNLIYEETFDDLSEKLTTAEILKKLGWKVLYKNAIPDGADPDISKIGAQFSPELGENFNFVIENGALKIINGTYDKDGVLSGGGRFFVEILSEEIIKQATNGGDYTIQYDLTFAEESGSGWVSMAARYASDYRGGISYYASWRLSPNGRGLHEAQHPNLLMRCGRQGPNGENIPSADLDTTDASGWLMRRIPCLRTILEAYEKEVGFKLDGAWPKDPNGKSFSSQVLKGNKITIQMQIVQADSDYNYKPTKEELGDCSYMDTPYDENFTLTFGYHIWVVDENGQRYLVSAYNPEAQYDGKQDCSKENWGTGFGEALAFCTNAKTAVYLDNIKVWTGTDAEPNACQHKFETIESVKPGCDTAGYTKTKCSLCGREKVVDIPAYGHDYKGVTNEETMETIYTCANCGHSYKEAPCEDHKFSYSYEFVNKDIPSCSFGVYITATCENCGISVSTVAYECVTWRVDVDLSGYDHCGKHNFSYYTCPCGAETDWVDEGNINLDVELEGMPEGIRGYGCKNCDMTALISVSNEEGTCTESTTATYKFYFKSELIHTMTVSYFEYGHEPSADTIEFRFVKDENCESGVIVTGTCMECGEKIELLIYTHLEIVYERIEFSEYGACKGHYVQRYACACGKNDNIFVRNIDSIPSVDPDCTIYHCDDCGLSIEVVDKYGEPNEKCEIECTTIYTVTINKKEIKTFSIGSTEIKHNYVETIKLNNGKDCSDGVTIEYLCSVCGEYYAEGYEGHFSEEVELDLSKYGVCESHVIWVIQCKICGYVENIWSEDLAGYGTDDGSIWFCPEEKCGIRITEQRIVGEKNENCWAPVTFPTTLYVGDTEILSVTMHGGTFTHEYEETFELMGATCDDGILVKRTCKDCGDTETYEHKGHSYEEFNMDLSEYGCDEHYLYGSKCSFCETYSHIALQGGKIYNQKTETGRRYFCESCSIELIRTETYGEKDENCRVEIDNAYSLRCDGKEILSGSSKSFTRQHDFEYQYEFLGNTCEDGVRVTGICKSCKSATEYTNYSHQYESVDINLSEYGACDNHTVHVSKCIVCDTCSGIKLNGVMRDKGTESSIRYYCRSCALEMIETNAIGEYDGACRYEVETVYSLRYDGNEIFFGKSKSYREEHDFDYQYSYLGKNCEDGVKVTGTCKRCKATTEYTNYSHQFEDITIDLSEYGVCKDHVLQAHKCIACDACINVDISGKMYYQSFGNGARRYCKSCSIELIQTDVHGEKDEKCQIRIDTVFSLRCDGKEIFRGIRESYQTEHDNEYSYKFNDIDLGCEGGVNVIARCRACGNEENYNISSHDTMIEEKYSFVDYGHKCESGFVSIRSCPCGQNKHFAINNSGFTHVGGKGETINGVWHEKYSYVCDKCGYSVDFDSYSIKDENCNSIMFNEVSFGNHTISINEVNGKSHNSAEKEIPEESYITNNDDGTKSKFTSIEVYCVDCKASLEKRITEERFNAEGNVISVTHTYCNYVAVGEDGDTIAVIYRTEFIEYLIVETLKGKQSLTRAEVYTYYNEDGSTNVERHDYEYDKDSFCSYTVTHTDFNGNTNTERVEGRHPSTDWRYVLNANSETCLDGLDRVWYCNLCGAETNRQENVETGNHSIQYNRDYAVETIELSKYGAVCEAYAYVLACPCGERKTVEVDTKCDYINRGYGRTDKDGIMHNYEVYFCSVTDPVPCGFKWVREEWRSVDESCNEIRNYTYYFGVNETNDSYQYSYTISYATGNKSHSELKTDETVTDNLYSSRTYCVKCGMTERTEVIENCIKTVIEYRYHSNGALYSVNTRRYLAINNGEHWYTLERKYEYYNENGELNSWNQTEYTYPNAANGDYCTVIRTVRDMSGSENAYEENNHQWSWNGSYCTPTYVQQTCIKCGETRQELMSNNGHNFKYNSEKGCFVCWDCGLESASSGNGQVGFEDKTLELGNGTKYVIGWYNNYGGEYAWNVELINIANGEMYFLEQIVPEMINEYTIGLDAKAIAEAAKALGIADCGYMIRLSFVPLDGNGELDYAITLDPHVYVEESCVVPGDGCLNKGEYIWTYKCALCGNTYTESAMGHYYSTNVHRDIVSISDDGTITVTTTYTATCERCKQTRIETNIYVYASNGQILKRSYDNNDDDSLPFETTYSYDYVNGIRTIITTSNNEITTEKYDMTNDRQIYRKVQWIEGCYEEDVYDYENDLHTFTRESTVEHIIKRVRISKLSTGEEISQNVIYADGRTESYEYVHINGNVFTVSSMVEHSDKSWTREVGALDEANGVYVTTRTNSSNETWVWKHDLITGELVCEEYINADGNKQITTIEIDNEKGTCTHTTVYSDGPTFIRVESLKDGRILSTENIYSETDWNKTVYEYDDEKGLRTQNTTNSDGSKTTSVYDMINGREISYEHGYGTDAEKWYKNEYTYNEADGTYTCTHFSSDGTTVSVYTWPECRLISSETTYVNGRTSRTEVVVDKDAGTTTETTTTSFGYKRIYVYETKTGRTISDEVWEENGSYSKRCYTLIGYNETYCSYSETRDTENNVYIATHIYYNNSEYISSIRNTYADGSTYEADRSYDFDKDVCVEIVTSGEFTSEKRYKISTWEEIE